MALKGASAAAALYQQQQQPTTTKQYTFNPDEVNFLGKSLEVCRYFIGKNQNLYQNTQDIMKELNTANNIISARTKQNKQNEQSLKGASSLDNIRKMVGLTSNESLLNLKGASDSTPQNNICSKKEHLKDLLEQFNLI
jgi:hypothetical protein